MDLSPDFIGGGGEKIEKSLNFSCLIASTVAAASYRSLELPRQQTYALVVNRRLQMFKCLLSTKTDHTSLFNNSSNSDAVPPSLKKL